MSCSSDVTLFRWISLWVYHGLLPYPISSAKSAYAISFDYSPLDCVTSFQCITLEWHVWPGRSSKYNNNLHRDNFLESIRLAPKILDKRIENETRKLTTVCLPYVKDLAERIQKICSPHDIRTIFTSGLTLRKHFFHARSPRKFTMIINCVLHLL